MSKECRCCALLYLLRRGCHLLGSGGFDWGLRLACGPLTGWSLGSYSSTFHRCRRLSGSLAVRWAVSGRLSGVLGPISGMEGGTFGPFEVMGICGVLGPISGMDGGTFGPLEGMGICAISFLVLQTPFLETTCVSFEVGSLPPREVYLSRFDVFCCRVSLLQYFPFCSSSASCFPCLASLSASSPSRIRWE